jgi:UDP-N-acetylglucosamine 2-epimerase (non-hydrolysing)
VKLAPVIRCLRRPGSGFEVRVVTTGQQRALLDQALADFDLASDLDLDLMRPDQDLADFSARAIVALSGALRRLRPDLVLAQGDTTTVLGTALACYYLRIAFGHVEAGLRTGRAYDPFPEEKNRVLATHLADLHFAPTPGALQNLLREGIAERTIHVTGNTGIDALRIIAGRDTPLPVALRTPRFVLVTAHRRESFGAPLERIGQALLALTDRHPDLSIVFPVHPNPRVRRVIEPLLEGRDRIRLIEPVGYRPFVALLKGASLVLTDSGGVQEEGPALGKRVLVLRAATERPEGVESGLVRLVGTCVESIVAAAETWLAAPEPSPPSTTIAPNPYGDGWASERIARVLAERFGIATNPP